MGRGRATSSSSGCSSSIDSSKSNHPDPPAALSSSSFSHQQLKQLKQLKRDLTTDLRLGLSISHSASASQESQQHNPFAAINPLSPSPEEAMDYAAEADEGNHDDHTTSTLYVKVYMEGHAIGRKLDLLAHDSFHDLIRTLENMFNANVLWGDELDRAHSSRDLHVLTYEDEEGDWLIVGDVPWEMFLSAVKRLKITRTFPC